MSAALQWVISTRLLLPMGSFVKALGRIAMNIRSQHLAVYGYKFQLKFDTCGSHTPGEITLNFSGEQLQ